MKSKVAGGIVVDGQHVANTVQCVHCQKHWIPKPGSGITRGYCYHCMDMICGDIPCRDCIPFEAKLEITEAAKNRNENVINKLVSRYPAIKKYMSRFK